MLSQIIQTEKDKDHDLTYTWNLKNKINKQNRKKLTDTENKLIVVRWEGVWGVM